MSKRQINEEGGYSPQDINLWCKLMINLNTKYIEKGNLIPLAIRVLQENKSGSYSNKELLILINAIESFSR